MPLLAVDIGNTNVYAGIRTSGAGGWPQTMRFASRRNCTADDWLSMLAPHLSGFLADPSSFQVVGCSVDPALTQSFVEFSRRHLAVDALMVSTALDLGLTVATHHPAETGADRIVNAAAAFAGYGGPVIVVDMGTATKIDAVNNRGEFLGGAIAPGLGLTMDALAQRAAQLYAVPLTIPLQALGANTIEAIQAGVVLGHVKMVDGLVQQISSELGGANAVVLTGGYSSSIAGSVQTVTEHRPNLTLDGLAIIAARNA